MKISAGLQKTINAAKKAMYEGAHFREWLKLLIRYISKWTMARPVGEFPSKKRFFRK